MRHGFDLLTYDIPCTHPPSNTTYISLFWGCCVVGFLSFYVRGYEPSAQPPAWKLWAALFI